MICTWTEKLPEDCREAADEILLAAAAAGMAVNFTCIDTSIYVQL